MGRTRTKRVRESSVNCEGLMVAWTIPGVNLRGFYLIVNGWRGFITALDVDLECDRTSEGGTMESKDTRF